MKEILVLQQALETSSECINNDFFSWLLEDCIGSENDEVRRLAFENIFKIYEDRCFRWSEVKQALFSEFSSAETIDDSGIGSFRSAIRILDVLPQMELIGFMISKEMLSTIKTCCLARQLEVRAISVSRFIPILFFKVWTPLESSHLDVEGIMSLATAGGGSGDRSESESDSKQLKEVLKDSLYDFTQIVCMHINAPSVEHYPLSPGDVMNNVACSYSSSSYNTVVQGKAMFQACCGVLAQLYERCNYPYVARLPSSGDAYVAGLYANGINVANALCGSDMSTFATNLELDGYQSAINQSSILVSQFVKISVSVLSVDLEQLLVRCRAGASSIRFYSQLLCLFAFQDTASFDAIWSDTKDGAHSDSIASLIARVTSMKCSQGSDVDISLALASQFLNSQQFSTSVGAGDASKDAGFAKALHLPLQCYLGFLIESWCSDGLLTAITSAEAPLAPLSEFATACRDFICLTDGHRGPIGARLHVLRDKYGGHVISTILSTLLALDEERLGSEGREVPSILLGFAMFLLKQGGCRTLGLEHAHASTIDERRAPNELYHCYMGMCECVLVLFCTTEHGFNDAVCTRCLTELNSILFQHCMPAMWGTEGTLAIEDAVMSTLSEVLSGRNFVARCFDISSDPSQFNDGPWGTASVLSRHVGCTLLQREFMARLLSSLCFVLREHFVSITNSPQGEGATSHLVALGRVTLASTFSCLSWPLHGCVSEAPALTFLALLEEVCLCMVNAATDGATRSHQPQVRHLMDVLLRKYIGSMASEKMPGNCSKQAMLRIFLAYYARMCCDNPEHSDAEEADMVVDQVLAAVRHNAMWYDFAAPKLKAQLLSARKLGHLGNGPERRMHDKLLQLPRCDHFMTYMQYLNKHMDAWLAVLTAVGSCARIRLGDCEKLLLDLLRHLLAVQCDSARFVSAPVSYFPSILTSVASCYASLAAFGPLSHLDEFAKLAGELVRGAQASSECVMSVLYPAGAATMETGTRSTGSARVVDILSATRLNDIGTTRSIFDVRTGEEDMRAVCIADILGIMDDIVRTSVLRNSPTVTDSVWHGSHASSSAKSSSRRAMARHFFELHRYDSASLNNNNTSVAYSTGNGSYSTMVPWRCTNGSSDLVKVYSRIDKFLFSSHAVVLVRVFNTSGMKLPIIGLKCSIVGNDAGLGNNTSWSNDYVAPNAYIERCFDLDMNCCSRSLCGFPDCENSGGVLIQVILPDVLCPAKDEFHSTGPSAGADKFASIPVSAVLNCDILTMPVLSILYPFGLGAFSSSRWPSRLTANGGIPHFVYSAVKERLQCSSVSRHCRTVKGTDILRAADAGGNFSDLVDGAHAERNAQWYQYMFECRVNTTPTDDEHLRLGVDPVQSVLLHLFHTFNGDEVMLAVSVERGLNGIEGSVEVCTADPTVMCVIAGGLAELVSSVSAGMLVLCPH